MWWSPTNERESALANDVQLLRNWFVERLRELGWIENRTVAIEYRWGEGRDERFAQIAAELVRRNVDVIVTGGSNETYDIAG